MTLMSSRRTLVWLVPFMCVAVYVAVVHGHFRAEQFALLLTCFVGVRELAIMGRAFVSQGVFGRAGIRHLLIAIGALLVAFSFPRDLDTFYFVTGCVVFSAGLLIPAGDPSAS